jgi:hypothetical protein
MQTNYEICDTPTEIDEYYVRLYFNRLIIFKTKKPVLDGETMLEYGFYFPNKNRCKISFRYRELFDEHLFNVRRHHWGFVADIHQLDYLFFKELRTIRPTFGLFILLESDFNSYYIN